MELLQPLTACLVGGHIYVHGLLGQEEDIFYKYSIREDKWTTVAGCQHRFDHGCILVDDCIYVVGGERRHPPTVTRWGFIKAPIESYDLVLGEVQEHGICVTEEELVTYVESYRDIVFIGTLSDESFEAHVFGFNVDTKRLSKYRVTGVPPKFDLYASIVEYNGKVFFLSRPSADRMSMFMLSIGSGQTGRWAELLLTGHSITPRRSSALVVVDGLLLCFGGEDHDGNKDLPTCFIHPGTGEVIRVGDETSIQQNGELPQASSGVVGVSTRNKAWFYGASYLMSCAQAEFNRY